MAQSLTPAEDEELRLLVALAEYGDLTPTAAAVLSELRARDRRETVRAPRRVAIPIPIPVQARDEAC